MVKVGGKNSLSIGKDLQQNKAQVPISHCCDRLWNEGKDERKKEDSETRTKDKQHERRPKLMTHSSGK